MSHFKDNNSGTRRSIEPNANRMFGGGEQLDDFDFGSAVLPDDDDDDVDEIDDDNNYGGGRALDEFDAVNDETFGIDLSVAASVGAGAEDLDQYAEQTAHLSIADGSDQHWMHSMMEASITNLLAESDYEMAAKAAPPADHLPMPSFASLLASSRYGGGFGTDSMQSTNYPDYSDELSSSPYFSNDPLYSIWGSEKKNSAPEPCSSAVKSNNIINQLTNNIAIADKNAPLQSLLHQLQMNSSVEQSSNTTRLGPTVDEIEMHQKPTVKSPMMAADLERMLISEQQQQQHQRVIPPPPPHMMRPPWISPEMHAALLAQLSVDKQLPPTGFFPPPGIFRQPPMIPRLGRGGMMMPPNMIRPMRMPWPSSIGQSSTINNRMPPPPPSMSSHPQVQLVRMQLLAEYQREQAMKRAGLPSGRTICDYAFDPYAGLMSRKEREWLVKIQELQLQGCGNPYQDDYYYTLWKQRKQAQIRRSQGLKPMHTASTESDHIETIPHCYVPPTFEGSLGRPTLSTANFPRQLIDLRLTSVQDISVDEIITDNSSSSTTPIPLQHTKNLRFKSLLIELEHAWNLLLECEDRKRQLSAATLPVNLHGQLTDEIRCRLMQIINAFCGDRLPWLLTVRKGRDLLCRLLSLCPKDVVCSLITSLAVRLPIICRKDTNAELKSTLLPVVCDMLGRLSKDHLLTIWQHLTIDIVNKSIMANNPFSICFFWILLVCSARKRMSTLNQTPIVDLFRLSSIFNATILRTQLPNIDDDITMISQWLMSSIIAMPEHQVHSIMTSFGSQNDV